MLVLGPGVMGPPCFRLRRSRAIWINVLFSTPSFFKALQATFKLVEIGERQEEQPGLPTELNTDQLMMTRRKRNKIPSQEGVRCPYGTLRGHQCSKQDTYQSWGKLVTSLNTNMHLP